MGFLHPRKETLLRFVYKWPVPATYYLGIILRWTQKHPIQGGIERLRIFLIANLSYGNCDKLRPDGPAGSYEDRVASLLNYVIFKVLIKPESLATSNFEPPTFRGKKGERVNA